MAGFIYARKIGIPFVIDIETLADIFTGYFHLPFQFLLSPLVYYYRRKISKITNGAGITAVSQSQLNWGLNYSGRKFDSQRDKLLYIGYENKTRSKEVKSLEEFSERNH